MASCSVCSADQDDIRSPLFLKRMKFLFGWVFLITSLLCLANAPIIMQIPLLSHPYCYSWYVLDQHRWAPCTWDLICNIQELCQQGNSSQSQVEDEGVWVQQYAQGRSQCDWANQVYPGGLLRGCSELGAVSGSEYSPEWILPGPGR